MSPHLIDYTLFLRSRLLIWQQCTAISTRIPLILVKFCSKILPVLFFLEQICLHQTMDSKELGMIAFCPHISIESPLFFSSFAEGSLSPKLISPPTPAMYKYRPAFTNNPKVHYHATADQVSEPGRICSHLTLGSMEMRIYSLQGSSECQSVKVNNNTWHCCATVYICTVLPRKTCLLLHLSSVELDMSVLLTGMRCCFTSVSA